MSAGKIMDKVIKSGAPVANRSAFHVGDTVSVHVKIKEGDKERVQTFEGMVIAHKRRSSRGSSFTVRRVSHGVGVERVFPMDSPQIVKVERVAERHARRAKLYYVRSMTSRESRLKEKREQQ